MISIKQVLNGLPKVQSIQANQYIITTKDADVFQSYNTIIAVRFSGRIYLDKRKWDISTTTGKYRNQFLGMDKKETERLIKSGDIILTNLNQ